MRELCIFLVAFACYAALGQDALYLDDGFFLIGSLASRSISHTSHEAYLPQLVAFGDLIAGLGLPAHRVITLFSALGTAAGVALGYRALRLLEPTGSARPAVATALIATTPAVVFFATVVEYHGYFFAFSQLAFLAAAGLARHPTLGRSLLLGACTAAATLVHATGILLPALLLPLFLAERSPPAASRRAAAMPALLLVAVAVHLALVPAGVALCRAWGAGRDPGLLGGMAPWLLARMHGIPSALLWEWLLPFALVSVVSLAGFAWRATRPLATATWIGAGVYTVVAGTILGGDIVEHGAYLLPLVGPAALTCARVVPARLAWAMVAFGAVTAVVQVRMHARQSDDYAVFVHGAAAAAAGKPPLVLTAARAERAACAVLPLAVANLDVSSWALQPAERLHAGLALLPSGLATLAQGDKQILVSDASLAALDAAGDNGKEIAAALRSAFRTRRVEVAGFHGYLLDQRR